MKRIFIVLQVLLIISVFSLYADEAMTLGTGVSGTLSTDENYTGLNASLEVETAFLDAVLDLSAYNNSDYLPHGFTYGYYFYVNDCSINLDLGSFELQAGRKVHEDVIDSPYSLFISSKEIPAVLCDFTYTGEKTFYTNRWIRLNDASDVSAVGYPDGFPDRGANLKVYGLTLGDFTFGYQDSCVYTDRSFDYEFFVSPLPQLVTQLTTSSDGRPWTRSGNDNSMMGFFFEFDRNPYYACSQVLIDDINVADFGLGFLVPDRELTLPTKMAWSLGGTWISPIGTLGLFHAGATKYTFESTYANTSFSDYPYEYVYYPATEYYRGSDLAVIDYETNYIGYYHGENNISIMLIYENDWKRNNDFAVFLRSALEYTISGSKSPANPWHEYDWFAEEDPPGTKLLDDDVLEHSLAFSAGISFPFRNLLFSLDASGAYTWNKLALEEIAAEEPKRFSPVAGNNGFSGSLTLSVHYSTGTGK